jgi:hypothetical protein
MMSQQHMVVNSPIIGGLVVLEHGHFSVATIIIPLGNISKGGPIGGSYLGALHGVTINWEILH